MRIWKFLDVVKEIGGWEEYEKYQIEVGEICANNESHNQLNVSTVSDINDL